jgi:hypothetical protein
MAHLGEFGRELAEVDEGEEPDTFTFHGQVFVIPASISALPALRYAWRLAEARAEGDAAAALSLRARTDAEHAEANARDVRAVQIVRAAVYEFLASVIGPEQWVEFEKVAIAARASQDELMGVSGQIVAAITDRPSRRPSGSPGGPSTSGAGSAAGSPSQDSQEPTESTEPLTENQRIKAQIDLVPIADAARSGV